MAKAGPDLLVIDKVYDLAVWSARHVAKFPRSHKFTLGDRLTVRLYEILELLLRAKYRRDRRDVRLRDDKAWLAPTRDGAGSTSNRCVFACIRGTR